MGKPRIRVNNDSVMSALVELFVNGRPISAKAVKEALGGGSLKLISDKLDKLIIPWDDDDKPFRGEIGTGIRERRRAGAGIAEGRGQGQSDQGCVRTRLLEDIPGQTEKAQRF